MRLINADAFIGWIDDYVSVFKRADKRDIINYINQQPTVNAYKWIPCEERMPEEDGTYLVAYTWKGDYSGTIYNEVLLMDFEHGKWESREKILAWMPLPPSYKRGEDND